MPPKVFKNSNTSKVQSLFKSPKFLNCELLQNKKQVTYLNILILKGKNQGIKTAMLKQNQNPVGQCPTCELNHKSIIFQAPEGLGSLISSTHIHRTHSFSLRLDPFHTSSSPSSGISNTVGGSPLLLRLRLHQWLLHDSLQGLGPYHMVSGFSWFP